ncbi:MAG: LytR/AlgR family response regulator transcription factor [Christensenellales bacterium]|jgi:DNA-binding LytR/AlgR family response regulator
MNIVICDDDSFWVEEVRRMVTHWAETSFMSVSFWTFSKGSELLDALRNNRLLDIDLVFLDIDFEEKIDGIAVSRHIRNEGHNFYIIFISGNPLRASQGYEVDAVGYLVKPFDYDVIAFYMNRVKERMYLKSITTLEISVSNGIALIPHIEIVCAETYGHELKIYTVKDILHTRMSMQTFFEKVDNAEFVRIHKSYIVNMRYVRRIITRRPQSVEILYQGEIMTRDIGRTYFKELQQRYTNAISKGLV